jgi:hypothetical protein
MPVPKNFKVKVFIEAEDTHSGGNMHQKSGVVSKWKDKLVCRVRDFILLANTL